MRSHIALATLALVLVSSSAAAQMTLPKAGKETKLLQALVGQKKKAGKKHPPMMKPVDSKGTMTCKWTAGKLWIACDIDEDIQGGPFKKMQAHVVMGWDFNDKGYRAQMVTMQGGALAMNGWVQGNKLIFQSQPFTTPVGKTKVRWTFDLTDKSAIVFHDERSIGGMDWFTFEKTTIR